MGFVETLSQNKLIKILINATFVDMNTYKWDQVDWSKQTVVIAAELGRCESSVSAMRKRLGKPESKKYHHWRKTKYEWDKVDWSKRNVVIAEELRCNDGRVSDMRKILGKPQSRNCHKWREEKVGKSKYKWGNIDWLQNDAKIARKVGCHHAVVAYRRNILGKPMSPNHRKIDPEFRPTYDFSQIDWRKTDAVISRELGCCPALPGEYRKVLGKPMSPNFHKKQQYMHA